jgi:hypothetical protein
MFLMWAIMIISNFHVNSQCFSIFFFGLNDMGIIRRATWVLKRNEK